MMTTSLKREAKSGQSPDILPNKLAVHDKNINYVAGFRRRIYDSNNLLEHVLAECLYDKVLKNIPLSTATEGYVRDFLERGESSAELLQVAAQEDLHLEELLLERLKFESLYSQKESPEKVIHIIGSPRSGTTHLFNLLAYQSIFSYFTAISHYMWSSYNFSREVNKQFIEDADPSIFELDNMFLRYSFTPLILPSESQEIFNKAINVQQCRGKFEYSISKPNDKKVDLSILESAIEKHVSLFKRKFFLSKDPFNSLRLPYLNNMYQDKTYLICIKTKRILFIFFEMDMMLLGHFMTMDFNFPIEIWKKR